LIAIAALAVLGSLASVLPARTADIVGKAAQAPPPVWPTWTGAYGGFQAGYGSNNSGDTVTDGVIAGIFGSSPHGLTGGLRAGYDWQLGSALVFGVEADASLAGFSSTAAAMPGLSLSNASDYWMSTNVRLGLPIFGPHWLPYVIGGFAAGGAKSSLSAANLAVGTSNTNTGWDIGGGIEVRITPHLSAYGEYRYIDLGGVTTPAGIVTASQSFTYSAVLGGLLYRF
jgi:outer membrane immunogenic protein